jgi:hypothetical protein
MSLLSQKAPLIAGIIIKGNNFSLAMIIAQSALFLEHLIILKDLFMKAN